MARTGSLEAQPRWAFSERAAIRDAFRRKTPETFNRIFKKTDGTFDGLVESHLTNGKTLDEAYAAVIQSSGKSWEVIDSIARIADKVLCTGSRIPRAGGC